MPSKVNITYLGVWMTMVAIGMFQFGYAIGHFNILTKMLFKQYAAKGEEVIDDQDNFNSLVTTVVPVGAVFGAFTGGALWSLGRRNAIFIVWVIIAAGSAITMIFNFYALLIGRLLLGYGAGAFTVICPLFISETSPASVAGSLGAINQFMVTFGIMVADTLGYIIPYEYLDDGKSPPTPNPDILDSEVWRVIFIIPAIVAGFQFLVFLFIFRLDTPKYYKQKGQDKMVEQVEERIYTSRGSEINRSILSNEGAKEKGEVPFKALFTPRYRKAFIAGCLLAVFQQLTGINAVIFYSTDIFTRGLDPGYDNESAAKTGTMLVGVVNWAATMITIPLLSRFGRKTLLIFGQITMGISLAILGILAIEDWAPGIKIFTLCFVAFFEFSIGPILWLYAAEIMTEKGMAAASLITWIITIIFGLFTGKLFDLLSPEGMYFTFTGIDILGLLFILFFIKETLGKSKDEISNLYSDRRYSALRESDDSGHTNDV